MSYYVYIHTCPNNKRYVGITTKIPKYRWSRGSGYKPNKHFFNAILKYGWDNISHNIIEVDTKEEMFYLERYLMSYYQTNNPDYGYNRSVGGEFNGGFKHSEETKERMRESYKKSHNDDYKKHMSIVMTGKTHSEETKQKIHNSRKDKIKVVINDIEFDSISSAAKYFGLDKHCLTPCLKNNKNGFYKGYKIAYVK